MPTVLALDLGSSSAKGQRFDAEGRPIGRLDRRPAGLDPNGRADAERAAADVEDLLDALVSHTKEDGAAVDAVGISSAWHTLVGVDGHGRATTELSTWMDPAAGPEAAELRGLVIDQRDVQDRTGAPIHPSLPSTRLLWLARHERPSFIATERWCSFPEFLVSRWFDDRVGPSSSIASASGLYDQRDGVWDAELLDALSLPASTLAPVDDEPRYGLAPEYAARWPSLAGVPWFPAIGDGACALVGSGRVSSDRAALTVGTSAAVRVVRDRRTRFASPLPAPLFGYLLDIDRCVVGAARSNAGNLVAWARSVFGVDDETTASVLSGRPPGSHGLRIEGMPVVERSPSWPLTTAASISGLRATTTAADVLHALVEHAIIGIADAVDALEAWSGPQQLVVGGGAAADSGWRQLLADALGRPLVVSGETEASLRGAAVLALERLGEAVPNAGEIGSGADVVEPDRERAEAFATLRVG